MMLSKPVWPCEEGSDSGLVVTAPILALLSTGMAVANGGQLAFMLSSFLYDIMTYLKALL